METETNTNETQNYSIYGKLLKLRKWLTLIIVVAIVVIAIFIINYPTSIQSIDCDVACCIGENSVMTVLKGCIACNKQKELFGNVIEDLNIIYCDDNGQFCADNEIIAVPTWIINNEKYVGVQSIDKLKELTGC